MSNKSLFYELSDEVDSDLDQIFDYTEKTYGFEQAVTYVSDFDITFERIIQYPESGRERPEIRQGLRSIAIAEHIVFYRVLDDRIRIVRILHGSRDLPKYFK